LNEIVAITICKLFSNGKLICLPLEKISFENCSWLFWFSHCYRFVLSTKFIKKYFSQSGINFLATGIFFVVKKHFLFSRSKPWKVFGLLGGMALKSLEQGSSW